MDEKKQKDIVIAWLKDAYAMERALEKTLAIYIKEAQDDYPMVADKLSEHLEETKNQAGRLKTRLEEMDEDPSTVKDLMGEVMGRVQGHGNKLSNDTAIKNALAAFASEYFEIACYQALATAAEKIGDDATAELARQSMEEEQAMADWAEGHLPGLVEEFMEKEK